MNLPSLVFGELGVKELELSTEGAGTGRDDTGGHASSQQLMPRTGLHHHPLFLMYSRNTNRMAPRPAKAPSIVPPFAPGTNRLIITRLDKGRINLPHSRAGIK